MSTAQMNRLVDEQNQLWARMQEIRRGAAADGDREWTAEERTNWDQADQRMDVVSGDIERLERADRLDAIDRRHREGDDPTPADPEQRSFDEAFWGYVRRGMNVLPGEQRQLMEQQYAEIETRAQGTVTGAAGGFTVPEGFRARITETLKAFGGLINDVEVITTAAGNDLPWPTNDDTANEGEIVGENTQVTEQDLVFGSRRLRSHTFTSKIVRVAFQLLQDTGVDLEAYLARKLGERIGRRSARAWATGTGVDEPQGITVGITVGKTGAAGQIESVIYDDLIDLEHSVDPAYRMRARYVFHDQTLKAVRRIVDTEGRPLFLPVPAPGFPSTINGWPYTVDNSMPEMAAGANSIVFGDVRSGYTVRQVLGVQMLRLEERYADFLQIGFLAFSRMDGLTDDSAAIRAYQNAAV